MRREKNELSMLSFLKAISLQFFSGLAGRWGISQESLIRVYVFGKLLLLLSLWLSGTKPCKTSLVLGEHSNSFIMALLF